MAVSGTDGSYGYVNPSYVRAFSTSNTREKTEENSKTESTEETPVTGQEIDAVFGDSKDKQVSMEDFLTLMIAQLKNQDFMNPVDDTQYVTQLAQISTMQQMEEMSYNAKSTYVASLVGKNVVAAKFTVSGDLKKTDGIVNKISLLDGKFVIYVNGEAYDMDQIMEIKTVSATEPPKEPEDGPNDDKNDSDKDDGGKDDSGKV